MSFDTYRGGLYVGAGFKPDGDSGFPLMETCDIQADAEGRRLDVILAEMQKAIAEGGGSGSDGSDGETPYIGSNGNWWIGETDTGVQASGSSGSDGGDGSDGEDGNTPYIQDGYWYIDGVNTGIKAEGSAGSDGVGISKIEKTSTSGLVDTYTITLTNGNTYTFTVTNGKDGVDGKTPYIGENGNWWIGSADTGVKAEGSGSGTVSIESVDASKVVFSEDVYTGYAVGSVTLTNGKGLFAQKGQTLLDVLKKVYSRIIYPSKTNPSVTVTLTNAGAKEVGTVFTPKYSATFNKGSYALSGTSIDSGVTLEGWEITDTAGNSSTSASGSFASFTVADGTNYYITAKATHSEGIVPEDSEGNDCSDKQIKAGTVTNTSGKVTGYRNTFYGTLTHKNITADNIRNLTKSGKALNKNSSFTINIPVGALCVVFAYPASLRDFTKVIHGSANMDISNGWTRLDSENTPVKIKGAGNDEGVPYKVYYRTFGAATTKEDYYKVTI